MRQPGAGGCTAEQVEVLTEDTPDLAVVAFDAAAIHARHPQRFERDALRVQHAHDIVVGDDEQVGGRTEGGIGVAEQARVDVAVRTDQR